MNYLPGTMKQKMLYCPTFTRMKTGYWHAVAYGPMKNIPLISGTIFEQDFQYARLDRTLARASSASIHSRASAPGSTDLLHRATQEKICSLRRYRIRNSECHQQSGVHMAHEKHRNV